MIYYGGNSLDLWSIVESLYLEEEFDCSVSSNIHVNPENPTYLVGKIIIINSIDYDRNKIKVLKENRCKIISRVILQNIEEDDFEISPYILRPCFDVLWNGIELRVKDKKDLDNILRKENIDNESSLDPWQLVLPDYKLYFPKIVYSIEEFNPGIVDNYGNLTWLGWLLQQVGQNIKTDATFLDMDLIKTKKMDFKKR